MKLIVIFDLINKYKLKNRFLVQFLKLFSQGSLNVDSDFNCLSFKEMNLLLDGLESATCKAGALSKLIRDLYSYMREKHNSCQNEFENMKFGDLVFSIHDFIPSINLANTTFSKINFDTLIAHLKDDELERIADECRDIVGLNYYSQNYLHEIIMRLETIIDERILIAMASERNEFVSLMKMLLTKYISLQDVSFLRHEIHSLEAALNNMVITYCYCFNGLFNHTLGGLRFARIRKSLGPGIHLLLTPHSMLLPTIQELVWLLSTIFSEIALSIHYPVITTVNHEVHIQYLADHNKLNIGVEKIKKVLV